MNENYIEIDKREIPELHGEVSLLEHKKTGARLLLIDNKNHNKTFSIGFRTPPEDSTGVAHIVEHSTLSGSRKYKTKEPFMDMVGSSLQTFLNAMTYPDKTIYPISSRNDKDFRQLMDLYLDAVFYPSMKENKNIFYQEGWHAEIQDDRLIKNGVVYNEMKGVYSDPSNQVSDIVRERLHPAGTYSHDSGGNPEHIPELRYEDFLAFHERFYHPSNSYILLAGDMDFAERLDYLDREYLSQFTRRDPASEIVGHDFYSEPQEFFDTYDLEEGEDGHGKSYFAMAYTAKENPDAEDLLLRSFFQELLVESENGILKRKLREAEIGEDIYTELSAGNTWDFTIVAYHAEKEQYERFKEIVTNTLEDLAENGFDEDILRANLAKFEFSVRRGGGAHADLLSYIGALNTWLYDKNPLDGIELLPKLNALRLKIGSDYFSEKIREYFLNAPQQIAMRIDPEAGKQKRLDAAQREREREALSVLPEAEKERIRAEAEALIRYQQTPDSPEDKASIPKLEPEDVEPNITPIPRKAIEVAGVSGTENALETNGIVYTNLAFDMRHLDEEELYYASILSDLLSKVETEAYDPAALDTEIYLSGGGITFETPVEKSDDGYTPYFFISTGALPRQLTRCYDVLHEIMTRSRFDDAARIRTLLESVKADIATSLLQSGHQIVSARVRAHFHEAAYVDDLLNGLNLYFFLADLLKKGDFKALTQKLKGVYEKLFTTSRLKINLIAEEKDLDAAKTALAPFLEKFPKTRYDNMALAFSVRRENEAFLASSQVNYVAKGGDIHAAGFDYDGRLAVLSNVLSNRFLHNEIRAKGGAYGAGVRITRAGEVACYSYRDPRVPETIAVYDKMAEFLATLEMKKRDLDDMIIGTMNAFDPHLSPPAYGVLDFKRYLNGTTAEEIQKRKEEALATTVQDLKSYGPMIQKVMAQNHVVAMGNSDVLKQNTDLFDRFESIKR